MKIEGPVIFSELPDGIAISDNEFGKCLIATKQFKKGDIIYYGCMLLKPEDDILEDYDLVITKNGEVFNGIHGEYFGLRLNKHIHFVQIGELRQLYGFDGYMNHSCNPTTICDNQSDVLYNTVAFRDIEIGDEITCDYALFDYECNGHEIPICGCKSSNCRGSMTGFKNLSMSQQLSLLHLADDDIVDLFVKNNNLINVGKISCPPHVEIYEDSTGNIHSLKSTKSFEVGDVVYENSSVLCNGDQQVLFMLNGKYDIAHNDLFIVREQNREFLCFDSFMNHSCDPNTKINYTSPTGYQMVAIKPILIGDELTCDYNCLDNNFTGELSVPRYEFECVCGTNTCRKKIFS